LLYAQVFITKENLRFYGENNATAAYRRSYSKLKEMRDFPLKGRALAFGEFMLSSYISKKDLLIHSYTLASQNRWRYSNVLNGLRNNHLSLTITCSLSRNVQVSQHTSYTMLQNRWDIGAFFALRSPGCSTVKGYPFPPPPLNQCCYDVLPNTPYKLSEKLR